LSLPQILMPGAWRFSSFQREYVFCWDWSALERRWPRSLSLHFASESSRWYWSPTFDCCFLSSSFSWCLPSSVLTSSTTLQTMEPSQADMRHTISVSQGQLQLRCLNASWVPMYQISRWWCWRALPSPVSAFFSSSPSCPGHWFAIGGGSSGLLAVPFGQDKKEILELCGI